VIKAFSKDNSLLERATLTVSSNSTENKDKLVPTNFSTGDNNFRFTNPKENPYRTTEKSVTVSGIVPKNQVAYITVNGFRLKKFVPGSTSWYYYANITYATMREGFNLYEIRFYNSDNTLLSTQAFTIIKEGGITLS
jgi:hypothetical protein